MQSIAPLNASDFLGKAQKPLAKFEVFYGCCWADITNFLGKNRLKSISISEGGAETTPEPIGGSWSATIDNSDGIFDPDSGTAPFNEYFRVGRKVKILLGAKFDGIDYYWRRFYGFMEDPKYSIASHEISLNGFDSCQHLSNVSLKSLDNYWGSVITFDSKDSGGLSGPEIYTEADAMDTLLEAPNVDNWVTDLSVFEWVVDAGGLSTWVGKMTKLGPHSCSVYNPDIGSLTSGKEYKLSFKYKRVVGTEYMVVNFYQQSGGTWLKIATSEHLTEETYETTYIYLTPITTGALKMELSIPGDADDTEFRIDQISMKEYTPGISWQYQMPSACTGIYHATLDGESVWQGERDVATGEMAGWYHNQNTNCFYFDKDKKVEAGTANLIVYYFTSQIPENVVADLLVTAGLYSNQAEALADMIYIATGITIDKAWFDSGSSVLEAIRIICERLNYRFWFNYSGRPVFKPAPTAKAPGSEDFVFTESDIADLDENQDRNEIRNRIVIKGIKQAPPVGSEETQESELTGENSNIASMHKYGEHTWEIKNNLFQDQTTIDSYCAIYLAAFKDPKWYATFKTPFNCVPLDKGDTVKWKKKYPGGVAVDQRGIIRDIKIDNFDFLYTMEKVV